MWNQRADSGDHEHHHHRQLVELEGSVDLEIAHRHPREIGLDERRRRSGSEHLAENRDGEQEAHHQHSRSDDAHYSRPAMSPNGVMIVTGSGGLAGSSDESRLPLRIVLGGMRSVRIVRAELRAREREPPVDDKPEQRENGQHPHQVNGVHPRSSLMSWMFTVCR